MVCVFGPRENMPPVVLTSPVLGPTDVNSNFGIELLVSGFVTMRTEPCHEDVGPSLDMCW